MLNRFVDPIKYYDLESYLLDEVQPRFQQAGYIDAFDFFSIIIWKANRVKSKIASKLKMVSRESDLDQICENLTKSISKAKGDEERMRVLIEDWDFRLPMASAVLSILFPDKFTIYDYRVAEQVGYKPKLAGLTRFDVIWTGYTEFMTKVVKTGKGATLRDKDRFFWGNSRMEGLRKDIGHGFPSKTKAK